MDFVMNLLSKYQEFPVILNKRDGEELKKRFLPEKAKYDSKIEKCSFKHRYFYDADRFRYVLLEEYLFSENHKILDLKKAIGINYYLSKKEI